MAAARQPSLDLLKLLGAHGILWHHLASYGPVAAAVATDWPASIDWLYGYGRMAVVVFFVVTGYLSAPLLTAPPPLAPLQRWGQRARRLVPPYLAAILLAVLSAALVRPGLTDDIVPAPPGLAQVIAHTLLVQSLLGFDSLNLGVWYVAMDLQILALYLAALAIGHACRYPALGGMLVGLTAAASLLGFNRWDAFEDTGLYFYGLFALGVVAARARNHPRRHGISLLLSLGMALALWVDFRWRLVLGWGLALALIYAPSARAYPAAAQALLARWGERAYSLFLVHFSVYLGVSLAFVQSGARGSTAGLVAMAITWGLSLVAATAFHAWVERPLARQWRGT